VGCALCCLSALLAKDISASFQRAKGEPDPRAPRAGASLPMFGSELFLFYVFVRVYAVGRDWGTKSYPYYTILS
jgi:hypothetical protein